MFPGNILQEKLKDDDLDPKLGHKPDSTGSLPTVVTVPCSVSSPKGAAGLSPCRKAHPQLLLADPRASGPMGARDSRD